MQINLLFIAVVVFLLMLTGLAITVVEFRAQASKQREDNNLNSRSPNK